MGGGSKILVLAAVIIVAFILQLALIGVDRHESPPGEVAVDFSKAYFYLDADMGEMLCSELTGDEDADVVDDYIHRVAAEARAEGFDPSWKKMALSHIDLKTEMVDENTAKIQISGERRRSINPLFAVVAKIFCLGDTYKVEEILTVVKEEDGWKVCGQPFDLTES
jgi:hypothetical protein